MQLKFNFNDDNELPILCELQRSKTPIVTNVILDNATNKISECFDYDFNGENKFYPFEMPNELLNLDFNILCIVGASGAGKSVFSKYYGEAKTITWDNSKCILSNFDNIEDGIERLNSVGLNSIPTWCKPRNVLSIGEGFRADLAKQIDDNCVIDEFTSTIDRNVALSCSKSISKYIRMKNLKRCVFVSCHKDFIDMLMPDYVIDLDDKCVYDTRRCLRRKIVLSIHEINNKREMWDIFKPYHYLSSELNIASKCYVAFWEKEIVGFIAIATMPSGTIQNGFRVHRLVVLPDYQGLGIGTKLLNWAANLMAKTNCSFYIRTSNFKLHNYLQRNPNWIETQRSGTISPPLMANDTKERKDRIAYSYKYIGKYDKFIDLDDTIIYNSKPIKRKIYKQDSMFNII